MRHFKLILVSILLLSESQAGNAASFIAGPGSAAVVNLGTKFNTTATLNWSTSGPVDSFTIAISPNPPSNGSLTNVTLIRVAAWKTSCVINGLPPGTYYCSVKIDFKGIGYSRLKTPTFSNAYRIFIPPGNHGQTTIDIGKLSPPSEVGHPGLGTYGLRHY